MVRSQSICDGHPGELFHSVPGGSQWFPLRPPLSSDAYTVQESSRECVFLSCSLGFDIGWDLGIGIVVTILHLWQVNKLLEAWIAEPAFN